MKKILVTLLLFAQLHYSFAQSQHNIPKGDIKGPFVWKSKIYPGTERDYWIYVPQQYDATKPA